MYFVEELFCQFTYKVSVIIYQYSDNSVTKHTRACQTIVGCNLVYYMKSCLHWRCFNSNLYYICLTKYSMLLFRVDMFAKCIHNIKINTMCCSGITFKIASILLLAWLIYKTSKRGHNSGIHWPALIEIRHSCLHDIPIMFIKRHVDELITVEEHFEKSAILWNLWAGLIYFVR